MVIGSTWDPLQLVVGRVHSSFCRESLGSLTAGCRESPPVVIGSTWGPLQMVVESPQWLL